MKTLFCSVAVMLLLVSYQANAGSSDWVLLTGGDERQIWWGLLKLRTHKDLPERYEGFSTIYQLIEGALPQKSRFIAGVSLSLTTIPEMQLTNDDIERPYKLLKKGLSALGSAADGRKLSVALSLPVSMI